MALIEIRDKTGNRLAAADDLSDAIHQLVDTIKRCQRIIRNFQRETDKFSPTPSDISDAASKPNQLFQEWRDPKEHPLSNNNALTINGDPQYDVPGTILIGLQKNGDYQNIVLSEVTALHFAEAILAHFGVTQPGKE